MKNISKKREDEIRELILRLTALKSWAFQLDMYQTGHALENPIRQAGWELAGKMEGKMYDASGKEIGSKEEKKSLDYYKRLKYKIIIEYHEDSGDYMAYCHELGKMSCYGLGPTENYAVRDFLQQKDEFIELLYDKDIPIREPSEDA